MPRAGKGVRDGAPKAAGALRARLRDDALGGIGRARVGRDVEHDGLRLDRDDPHGQPAQARAPSDHAAGPAGLRLHPAAAVEQPALPQLAGRRGGRHRAPGDRRARVQLLACDATRLFRLSPCTSA